MRIVAALDGNLAAHMTAELEEAEKAVTGAVRQAGEGLKRDWRAQITAAGLGQRLARTIRNQHYPRAGASLGAAAMVWSKAPVIVGAHDAGPLIRSKNGFWLAIPMPAAGKALGGRRITPGAWEQKTGLRLRFVYRRGVPSLLVADQARITRRGMAVASRSKTGRGAVTAPIFILVPQVRLRKRLDLERATRNWESRLPELVVAKWREERI